MSNEITAYFKGRIGVAESVYQYDYGMILIIDDLELPSVFEVHFELPGTDEAIIVVGQDNRVAIPKACLDSTGVVTAYIYTHEGENDGETEYIIRFNVMHRARPVDDGTGDERSYMSDAIALMQHVSITGEVANWLEDHPEATTTVQDNSLSTSKYIDGSITEEKLEDAVKLKLLKGYVTPEMFGAVGDGTTDDTDAVQAALNSNLNVVFTNSYKVSGTITLEEKAFMFGFPSSRIVTDGLTIEMARYSKVTGIEFIVDNSYTGNLFYLENCRNCVIDNIVVRASERYSESGYTVFMLYSESSAGVFFNSILNTQIVNCNRGIVINSTAQPAWINDNYFNNVIITAFVKGIVLMGNGFVQNNTFAKITLQDGLDSSTERIGLTLLSSANNKFYIVSWADASGISEKYYAIDFNVPSNKRIKNKITGYIEGLLKHPENMVYTDYDFDYVYIDKVDNVSKPVAHLDSNYQYLKKFEASDFTAVVSGNISDELDDTYATCVKIKSTGTAAQYKVSFPIIPNAQLIFLVNSTSVRFNITGSGFDTVSRWESVPDKKLYLNFDGGTNAEITFIVADELKIHGILYDLTQVKING